MSTGSTGTVRPFAARLVRADAAERMVRPLVDPLEAAASEAPSLDPAAYETAAAALYVYRQGGEGSAYTGLVCEVDLSAIVEGQVRLHEAVQPHRVEALVQHHARTDEPPALVALLHRPGDAFARTLDEVAGSQPILDVPGPGLRQTVWRVADDATVDQVTKELGDAVLYVADGHHRVAAALEEWRAAGEPAGAGLLCVVHAMDGLRLSAFHRRVTGPVAADEVRELLGGWAEVRAVDAPPVAAGGTFGLYVGGQWFALSHGGLGAHREDFDVSLLEARVLEPLTRTADGTARSVEITTAHASFDELTKRCDADGGALFTLAPPAVETLTALADAGEVVPPKTTYFAPKPCTGIFLRAPAGSSVVE